MPITIRLSGMLTRSSQDRALAYAQLTARRAGRVAV